MARRRYRRYRRKSGRWSPNIVKISSQNTASSGEFFNYEELAKNPIQVSSGVSIPFTVKNFEITFTLESLNFNYVESITAYIMFVPQGMTVTSNYFIEHPEYIMAYKYIGSPNAIAPQSQESQQYQPQRIRTRLSRKLQTGDSVILYIQGSNQQASDMTYNIDGIVRWWSKAN